MEKDMEKKNGSSKREEPGKKYVENRRTSTEDRRGGVSEDYYNTGNGYHPPEEGSRKEHSRPAFSQKKPDKAPDTGPNADYVDYLSRAGRAGTQPADAQDPGTGQAGSGETRPDAQTPAERAGTHAEPAKSGHVNAGHMDDGSRTESRHRGVSENYYNTGPGYRPPENGSFKKQSSPVSIQKQSRRTESGPEYSGYIPSAGRNENQQDPGNPAGIAETDSSRVHVRTNDLAASRVQISGTADTSRVQITGQAGASRVQITGQVGVGSSRVQTMGRENSQRTNTGEPMRTVRPGIKSASFRLPDRSIQAREMGSAAGGAASAAVVSGRVRTAGSSAGAPRVRTGTAARNSETGAMQGSPGRADIGAGQAGAGNFSRIQIKGAAGQISGAAGPSRVHIADTAGGPPRIRTKGGANSSPRIQAGKAGQAPAAAGIQEMNGSGSPGAGNPQAGAKMQDPAGAGRRRPINRALIATTRKPNAAPSPDSGKISSAELTNPKKKGKDYKLSADRMPGNRMERGVRVTGIKTSSGIKTASRQRLEEMQAKKIRISRAKIGTKSSRARVLTAGSVRVPKGSRVHIGTGAPRVRTVSSRTVQIPKPGRSSVSFAAGIRNIVKAPAELVKAIKPRLISATLVAALAAGGFVTGKMVEDDREQLALSGYTAFDENDTNSKNLSTVAIEDIETRREGYKRKILYGNANSTSLYASTASGNAVFDGSTIYQGMSYSISDEQLQLIADMCASENYDLTGTAVEASLMCNGYDWYRRNSLDQRNPNDFFNAIYYDDHTLNPDGHWFATSRGKAFTKADAAHMDVVSRVVRQGQRIIPIYVTEHDCVSDITSSSTPGQWIPNQTVLHNCYGSTYTYFCTPPNSDPFGYIAEVFNYYQEHPELNNESGGPVAGSGGTRGTPNKTPAKTDATKNIKNVKCYMSTLNGSRVAAPSGNKGVVSFTTGYTYAADAVYVHRYEEVSEDEDGNKTTTVKQTITYGTEHYTETLRVGNTDFVFKYTDKDGNDRYIDPDEPMVGEDEGLSYDEHRFVQAVVGATTVRTANNEIDPDKYLDYVYDMVDAAIKAGRGYAVEYETYETGNTRTWTFDGGYATAPEVSLKAKVTLDLDCNLYEIVKTDKAFKWDEDAIFDAFNYYMMDYEYFCMYHRADVDAGNPGGLTGIARDIYIFLSKKGMDDIHIAAILGNIQQESSMDPEAVQGSRWKGSDFDKIHYDGTAYGVNSEHKDTKRGYGLIQWTGSRTNDLQAFADREGGSWKTVDIQMGFFMEEYAANTTGAPWLHGAASREKFEAASDVDEATKVFFDDFEQPGDTTLPIRQRYAREFLAKIRSGGADVESYMGWVEMIANDDTHGYSQANREGDPDYDCSSLVWAALTQAGYDVGSEPFCTANETGILKAAGFTMYPYNESELQRGDICWRLGHTEFYYGDGQTIGAHDDFDGRTGDSSGKEICPWTNKNKWTAYFRPPASEGYGGGEDADLSIEADVKFDTFNTIAGIKLVIPGQNRNTGEGQAFGVDIIYGQRDTIDGCYAYAEGIWGQAATPGNAGKSYNWIDDHNEVWLNNWVNIKACWWEDGTVKGFINGKQFFEDHSTMSAAGAQIEGTAISNGHRIHAEFKNVRVKYDCGGKYGTVGDWRVYGWFGLQSVITDRGKVKSGRNGYCTNGAAAYDMSAVMDGTVYGAGGCNWDTTMAYMGGKPLSTIVQISANR